MTSILIMGGAGFIGSALLRSLERDEVTVFDNLSGARHTPATIKDSTDASTSYVLGDATSAHDIGCLFDRIVPRTVIHLVAETSTADSLYEATLNARVTVQGTAILLDEMTRRGLFPDRIVLASSRAVYGEGPYADAGGRLVHPAARKRVDLDAGLFDYSGLSPLAADSRVHLPKPVSIYGSCKLAQENLFANWCNAFGIACYIFRLQNVYGPGQPAGGRYAGVLGHFVRRAASGETVEVFEGGGISRDFIHVDDVAAVLVKAARGEGREGVYDIGSGERVRLSEVAEKVCGIGGGRVAITRRYRLGDVRHAAAEPAAAREAFQWRHRIDLSSGIRELYDRVRADSRRAAC